MNINELLTDARKQADPHAFLSDRLPEAEGDDRVRIFNALGVYSRRNREFNRARQEYDAALATTEIAPVTASLTHTNFADLVRIAFADYPQAQSHLNRAFHLAPTNSYPEAYADDQQGLVHEAQGNVHSGYLHVSRGLDTCLALSNHSSDDDLLSLTASLGRKVVRLARTVGRASPERDMEILERGLRILEGQNDTMGQYNTLAGMAEIEMSRERPQTALQYYQNAGNLLVPGKEGPERTALNLHLAQVHYILGNNGLADSNLAQFAFDVSRGHVQETHLHHWAGPKDGLFWRVMAHYEMLSRDITGIRETLFPKMEKYRHKE